MILVVQAKGMRRSRLILLIDACFCFPTTAFEEILPLIGGH